MAELNRGQSWKTVFLLSFLSVSSLSLLCFKEVNGYYLIGLAVSLADRDFEVVPPRRFAELQHIGIDNRMAVPVAKHHTLVRIRPDDRVACYAHRPCVRVTVFGFSRVPSLS